MIEDPPIFMSACRRRLGFQPGWQEERLQWEKERSKLQKDCEKKQLPETTGNRTITDLQCIKGATWCCIGWPLNQHSPNWQFLAHLWSFCCFVFLTILLSPCELSFLKNDLHISWYPVSDPVSYNWYRKRCHMPCPMIGKNGPQSIALARHWRIRKWSTQRHTAFFWA